MEKYSDNEVTEILDEWQYQSWCELVNSFDNEVTEMLEECDFQSWCEVVNNFDNDDVYEEVMNIQNILKKEGF